MSSWPPKRVASSNKLWHNPLLCSSRRVPAYLFSVWRPIYPSDTAAQKNRGEESQQTASDHDACVKGLGSCVATNVNCSEAPEVWFSEVEGRANVMWTCGQSGNEMRDQTRPEVHLSETNVCELMRASLAGWMSDRGVLFFSRCYTWIAIKSWFYNYWIWYINILIYCVFARIKWL